MVQSRRNRRWRDLSSGQRTALLTLVSAELAFTATAAVDLVRRPEQRIRGGKRLWWPLIFVQPVGPLLYLFWARRTG
jgi:hypothetical protein